MVRFTNMFRKTTDSNEYMKAEYLLNKLKSIATHFFARDRVMVFCEEVGNKRDVLGDL